MRFFSCAACEARTNEIDHLRVELTEKNKQIDTLIKRLTEIAEPGIDRRLQPPRALGPLPGPIRGPGPTTPPPPTLKNEAGANFPGYERAPGRPDYEIS